MKKTVQRTSKFKAFWGMFALVLVLGAGLFAENLAFVSHAESAAKVTASSAKIRKSADSSSEVIGSAAKPAWTSRWMNLQAMWISGRTSTVGFHWTPVSA